MAKPTLHFQRYEFKYFLPKSKADKIIPALLNYMEWDPYIKGSGRDYYPVLSLYFDSPDFGCFWDKESGIADRKKLRFRFYENNIQSSTPVFLEIKRKKDALIIKDRIKIEPSDCAKNRLDDKLMSLLKTDSDDDFLRELIWFKKRNVLRPKIFVSYNRKALVGRVNKKFRVTFDYDIKAALAGDFLSYGRMKNIYPAGAVLEVKYDNVLPFWFQEIIQKYQLERLAFSKYCNAVRRLVPAFDDNNYSLK